MIMIFSYALLLAGCLWASVEDIRKREIPNATHVLLLLSGFLSLYPAWDTILLRLLGAVILGSVLLILALKGKGLGGGDVKMAAALVFALGLRSCLTALAIGLCFSLLAYIPKAGRGRGIPLAPFFSLGCAALFAVRLL